MRRRRRPGRPRWGYVALIAGAVIVACMIMPPGFWWLLVGIALIALGLFALSRC